MIKHSTFNVYDRMDKKALKTMALAFEADVEVAASAQGLEFIKARLAIVYALLKYKIHYDWLPTPEAINTLPEPVRKFIHDIETNTNPTHTIRENILIKDTCKALVIKREEKPQVTERWLTEKAEETASDHPYVAFPNLITIFKKLLKEADVKVVKE